MLLPVLLLILLAAALLSWAVGAKSHAGCRWIALCSLLLNLGIVVAMWVNHTPAANRWWYDFRMNWVPHFGISLHLALDGLSLLMLALTFFLGALSVLISWKSFVHDEKNSPSNASINVDFL